MITDLLCSFLFFYSPSDHRDLHSFPTRRSSDLTTDPGVTCRGSLTNEKMRYNLSFRGAAGDTGSASRTILRDERSEEHTSELQSRRDLVCRLLLEKKKKIKENKLSGTIPITLST